MNSWYTLIGDIRVTNQVQSLNAPDSEGTTDSTAETRCPRCEEQITSVTIFGMDGPKAWPCGHRIPAHQANRVTGAGPVPGSGGDE